MNNPSLQNLTRHSDMELNLLADECLRRWDVARLLERGSKSYLYCYQWTAGDSAGWTASTASLIECEQKESISHVATPKNPPLWVRDGVVERKIKRADIFHAGSGAYIRRLAISPILSDITAMEKRIHVVLSHESVGFKGHVKNGGSPARGRSDSSTA